ncbi:MAG: cold shock domain-containing protein [Chitinophagaceae bacterium]|nr:cold shock domain-containing protein [Chitinophagaceae bacterium]
MAGTWNKREREKKKQQEKKEKEERKQERKENAKKGQSLDDMMAYIDEDGNISSTPPDPRKKVTINAEDIEIGVPKQRELSPEDLLRHGIVTFFNHDKGYGFIKDQQTQESIFVHINSSADELKENNRVVFEVEKGPRGLNAVNVRIEK